MSWSFTSSLPKYLIWSSNSSSALICCTTLALSSLLMNPMSGCHSIVPLLYATFDFFSVSLASKKTKLLIEMKTDKKVCNKKETVCVTTRANFFAILERLQRFCSGLFSALFTWFVERSKEKRRSIRRSADWIHRHNGKTAIIFFSNYSFINFYTHDLIIFQLQVFDSNKDGKLQLSEMAK